MAEEVFGWIEKSQRYAFNKSHAICYGVIGYQTAYIKAHFPLAFFTAWLRNARHKQDPQQEVFELVQDTRLLDIEVEPPDLLKRSKTFSTDRKVVKFGIGNVKGVGEAQVVKLAAAVEAAEAELGKPLQRWSWWEFLAHGSGRISGAVVARLIEVGALRWTGMLRAEMLAEFKAFSSLTKAEQKWVADRAGDFAGLVPALKALGMPKHRKAKPNKRRVPKKGKEAAASLLQGRLDELCLHEKAVVEQCEGGDQDEDGSLAKESLAVSAEIKAVEAELAKVTKWATDPAPEPTGPEGGCSSAARESVVQSLARMLESPPSPLVDTPVEIAAHEEELLGISITCGRIDACDVSAVNCTCKEFLAGRQGVLVLGVEVQQVREVKTKKGKSPGARMAFLTVSDATCALTDVVVFPDVWKEYGHLFREENVVIVQAERDFKDRDSNALHIKKAWQASPEILAA
jgi:DNA polymerase III alpha subunit